MAAAPSPSLNPAPGRNHATIIQVHPTHSWGMQPCCMRTQPSTPSLNPATLHANRCTDTCCMFTWSSTQSVMQQRGALYACTYWDIATACAAACAAATATNIGVMCGPYRAADALVYAAAAALTTLAGASGTTRHTEAVNALSLIAPWSCTERHTANSH
jgi:hypothetical protein